MSLASISAASSDHHEDLDEAGETAAPGIKSSKELLADAVVDASLTRAISRVLSEPGRVAIFIVPSQAYVEPVGEALRTRNPQSQLHLATEKKKLTWAGDPLQRHSVDATLVAVSQNPQLLLPSLHAAADVVVNVERLSARMVRKAINGVTGGRAKGLADHDLLGVDFDQIAACVRSGSTAAECVARLKRLRTEASPLAQSVPDLASLPIFGEAKAWALETVAEFQRLRKGEVVAGDVEHALLFGPPGTGKTVLARAVAKACGVRFFETSVSAWFTGSDGHLDGVLKAAEAFFQTLLENAPCLGLMDELEALPDRASLDGRHREWWASIITGVMLMVLRVRDSGKPVLLVGASNYLDRIDAALKRPGRLGRHVHVRAANSESEVADLLGWYLSGELDASEIQILSNVIGHATPAEVEGWVKAARRVARDSARSLTLDDLLMQVAPPDGRSAAELRNVALHEAGHAVATLVLNRKLKRVSIVADGTAGGITTWQARSYIHTVNDIEDHVAIVLAGRAADEILGRGADSGAVSDLEFATMRLAAAEANLGLRGSLAHRADDFGLRHLMRADPELLTRVELQLEAQMRRARALVSDHSQAVVAVAGALLARRSLAGAEVETIMADAMRLERTG